MSSIRQDTIYALASGQLPSGIAVIRISGPQTRFVIETITGAQVVLRRPSLREIRSADGLMLDRGLVIWFEAPASFTGEDYAELHLHGGRAVVRAVFELLSGFDGGRAAEAGEFTLRAFRNGKVDLTEAEALADLVEAETEEQRRFAVANNSGGHNLLYGAWRDRIAGCLAEMTALIDFADEDDVLERFDRQKFADIKLVGNEIDSHMKQFHVGEILRKGFSIAIIGEPNVGKSCLLNALIEREAAIVTDIPGTTRDVIEVSIDLEGYRIVLFDTAGIRESSDEVERIGVEKARKAAESADLILHLFDVRRPYVALDGFPDDVPVMAVGNKSDLLTTEVPPETELGISATERTGLEDLLGRIVDMVTVAVGEPDVIPFRQRHLDLLAAASSHLSSAIRPDVGDIELKAELLRNAVDSIGKISGQVDVEDLLDAIFARFCIGK